MAAAAKGERVDAYVALGANLGDRAATIEQAIAALAALPATTLVARSSLYVSPPMHAAGADYVNAVARLRTALTPLELLRALQDLEIAHGRERPYPNAPRTLDLDLLLHGDAVRADRVLTLPHPRLHERAFVVVPLAEIAPDAIVPGRGAVAALRAGVATQPLAKLDR